MKVPSPGSHSFFVIATILATSSVTTTHAHPDEVTYNFHWIKSADGDWLNADNWNFSNPPVNLSDNAHIPNDGPYTITIVDRIHTHDFNNTNPQATVRLRPREVHFVHGNFHNEGLYIIEDIPNIGGQSIRFETNSVISGNGRIELQDFDYNSSIQANEVYTLTHGAGHTISGQGFIRANFINNGTIEANAPDDRLVFIGEQLQNNGLLTSIAGTLRFTAQSANVIIDQTNGGVILADGGFINLSQTHVTGGIVEALPGSLIQLAGPTLIDTTLIGDFHVITGSGAVFQGTITNNAYIIVNPDAEDNHHTSIQAYDNLNLVGQGTFELRDNKNGGQAYNGGRIHAVPGATITLGQDQTILGAGAITGSFINNGTIIASQENHQLEIFGYPFVNNGILKATNNATLILDTNSTITQPSHRSILADNSIVQLTKADITGGSFESIGTGYFFVEEDSTIDSVVLNAPLETHRLEKLFIRNSLTNNNTLTINRNFFNGYSPLTIMSDLTIDGTGKLVLNGTSSKAVITSVSGIDTFTNAHGHTIVGGGQINTPLLNQGTLKIGFQPSNEGSNPVRTLVANAPITMDAQGTLKIGVANHYTSSLIESTSTFHATGTLDVSYIEDFKPTTAWTATIITASEGITGTFESIISPPTTDPRLNFQIRYTANSVRIGATCSSDLNFDSHVDFLDISMFLTAFAQQDPVADFNNDNYYNLLDISEFLNAYGAGCP